MNSKLLLSPSELEEVQSILKKYLDSQKYKIWIFGSRAGGKIRKDSDLDLLFDPSLDLSIRSQLGEAFEDSNLPFEVDLVNRADAANAYKDGIEKTKIELKF